MSAHSSKGPEWERTRAAVLKRDPLCVYCRERQATQVDHVVPKSKGGADDLTNLVGSCQRCNARKQDRTLERVTWTHPDWFGT